MFTTVTIHTATRANVDVINGEGIQISFRIETCKDQCMQAITSSLVCFPSDLFFHGSISFKFQSTGTSMANGSVLTTTPIRSNNSIGKSNGSINTKNLPNNNNNNSRLGNNETDTPSGANGLSDKGNNLSSDRKKVIVSNCPKIWKWRMEEGLEAHYSSASQWWVHGASGGTT